MNNLQSSTNYSITKQIIKLKISKFIRKLKIENLVYRNGFTLVEILVAIIGVSVLILAATGYMFSILVQRDQALSATIVSEQAETIFSVVGDAVRSAQSVAVLNGGSRLELTGHSECWTFEYDGGSARLVFDHVESDTCSPPTSATNNLNSSQASLDSATFSLLSPDDSSRSLELVITVTATRPLFTTTKNFDRVFVNVIDEE